MATQKTELVISARDQATQVIAQVNQGLVGLSRNLGGIPALAAGLSVGVLIGGLRSVINTLDDLGEAAQNAAITATVLADLRLGAAEAGVGIELLDKALVKLNILLAEARGGDRRAQGLLGIVGIDFRNQALDAAGALEQLAKSVSSYRDGAEKINLVQAILTEKVGPKFIAFLNQSEGGLRRNAGVTVENAAAASKLQTELDKLNAAWERQKIILGTGLVPLLTSTAEKLLKVSQAAERAAEGKRNFANLATVAVFMVRLVGEYRKLGVEARKAAEQIAFLDRILPKPGAKPPAPAVPLPPDQAAINRALAARKALAETEADAAREFKESGLKAAREEEERGFRRAAATLDAYNRQLARLRQLTGEAQTEEFLADSELLNQAFFDGRIGAEKYDEAIARLTGRTSEIEKDTKKTTDAAQDLALTFTSAFEDAVVQGRELQDVLKGIYQDLLRILTRPITQALGNALQGVVGGVIGGIGGAGGGTGTTGGGATSVSGAGASKSGVSSVTVINNYQIDSRSDRASIIAAMEQTRRQTEASIANSLQRNGAFARA